MIRNNGCEYKTISKLIKLEFDYNYPYDCSLKRKESFNSKIFVPSLALLRGVLVPENTNCNLIQPVLSFHRNHVHYYISNPLVLLQILLLKDFDVYNLKSYQTSPDL